MQRLASKKADFTAEIPDASIADGASTTGICLECAKKTCPTQIGECTQNCDCQELAVGALDCFLKNSTKSQLELFGICGGKFGGVNPATQQLGFGLLTCINGGCKTECATDSFQTKDAGKDAAGDAGDAGDAGT